MSKLFIFSLFIVLNIFSFPSPGASISSCNEPCKTLNDCEGQLICINGKCNDDPDVGTHVCSSGSSPSTPSPSGGSCRPSGTLKCNRHTYSTYECSTPITGSSTPAKLTLNSFAKGGDGGGPSECDDQYHSNSERVVALSTGWFAGKSRCGIMIRIKASNGRSTTAKVVDECDSMRGCDEEHDYQKPCDNNIVDGSSSVWDALGLNKNDGIVDITWSMA